MALDVEKELKIFWIAGMIVLIIYGLWFIISYETYHAVLGQAGYFDPVMARLVAAMFIAWLVVLIRLYKQLDNWEKIEEWVLFGVLVQILMIIVQIMGIAMYNILNAGTIIAIIINIFFTILGIHIIIQKRK
ncbi:MAG: hypothetical protein ACFE8A_07815 [Candidatus Hodarchaeota archaeon]